MRRSVVTIVVFLCLALVSGVAFSDSSRAASKKIGKVKGLKVIAKTSDSLKISWNMKKKATGYQVYRSDGTQDHFRLVKTVALQPGKTVYKWNNKKLKSETVYYYKVKAVNSSKFSAVATGKTDAPTFEDAKTTVTVSTYRDGTNISWTKLKGVDGYRIYRAYEGGDYKQIKQVKRSVTTYFDNAAASGKKCYYKVRGYKGFIFKDFTRYSARESINTIPRVYIACGHGTDIVGHWDTGCTYKGMTEAGLMLPITKSFVNYMRKSGVYVYTDADANNNKNMIACVREANKHKLSAYISIHCDWSKAPSGTLPLYGSKGGKVLATKLNDGVRSQVTIPTRGLCKRSGLFELNMSDAIACIFETGSIKYDYKIFQQKYDLYGKGMAMGLCNYLRVTFGA